MNLHVNEAGVEFGGQLNMNKNHDSSVLCLEPISINDVKHKTRLQEKKILNNAEDLIAIFILKRPPL